MTRAIHNLKQSDAARVASKLTTELQVIQSEVLDPELYAQLRDGGFLIEIAADEVAAIRERFRVARRETPIVLTVTTTLDCNLGCYYCYEERSQNRLSIEHVDQIVGLARQRQPSSSSREITAAAGRRCNFWQAAQGRASIPRYHPSFKSDPPNDGRKGA